MSRAGLFMDSDSNSRYESMAGEVPSSRKEAIRADIARRLRKICAHLPDEEFKQLVDKMAERQLKAERTKPF
jgi:hypothetical protein